MDNLHFRIFTVELNTDYKNLIELAVFEEKRKVICNTMSYEMNTSNRLTGTQYLLFRHF